MIIIFTKFHILGIFFVASLSDLYPVVYQWSTCGLSKTLNSSFYCMHIKQLVWSSQVAVSFICVVTFFQRVKSSAVAIAEMQMTLD